MYLCPLVFSTQWCASLTALPHPPEIATKPCSRARTISKFSQYLVLRLEDFTNTNRVEKIWRVPVPILLLQLLDIADHFEAAVRKFSRGRSRTRIYISHPATHMSHSEDIGYSLGTSYFRARVELLAKEDRTEGLNEGLQHTNSDSLTGRDKLPGREKFL